MALQAALEALVINKLKIWQGAAGTDSIADAALAALDPDANPYGAGSAGEHVNARLKDWTDELVIERQAGNLFPWVIPSAAAILFEGVFNTCVAYWVARGQPSSAAALRPDVTRFVNLQIRLFTTLVGAK